MVIRRCYCSHQYQDEKYGPQMRVMNPLTKSPGTYRCTVCGKEDTGNRDLKKKKK